MGFVVEGLAVTAIITEPQSKTLEVNRNFFGNWLAARWDLELSETVDRDFS